MKAYQLLSKRNAWTTGYMATDKDGVDVGERDKSACRWCAYGAINKCYSGKKRWAMISKLENWLDDNTIYTDITEWNDEKTSKKNVVKALRKLNI